MSKEFLAKKKEINTLKTDVNALKVVDERIWTNLDTINKTASLAQGKADQAYLMADDALTATRTNTTNINTLKTDVNALKAVDTSLSTRIDNIDSKASTAKTKAEEGVAKADSALARNIFTDEEKAKLANITNPMIIKGRVNTVNDLPTEAVVGWFYFVGLESASSYEEYCYSENGWEYIGLSQEGVDLSNYYTKKQVDNTVNALKAADTSLGKRIDNVDSKASTAKTKAEEGVTKADNALAAAGTNATNINSLQTDVNSLNTDVNALKTVDTSLGKRIDSVDTKASTAKTKAEEGVAKADNALAATRTNATNITNLQTDVTDLINEKNIMGSRLTAAETTLSNVKTTAETAETKADNALTQANSNTTNINTLKTDVNALKAVDTSLSTRIDNVDSKASAAKTKAEEGVAKADNALTATRTNANKIKAHANDIALNRTTLGTQCKNLLKNNAVTQTVNGVTFTVNSDGSVTVNGTNSALNYANILVFKGELEAGTYILSGAVSDVFRIRLGLGTTDVYGSYVGIDIGNGYTFTVTEKAIYTVTCQIASGKTASNVIFKPMLRYADITDDTYEPYQPSLVERCLLKDTAGINLGHAQDSSITIDNLSAYTVLWVNVSGGVSGINFQTNLIVPIAYLAKSSSNRVSLAGGIPSSAYITSEGPVAAKYMDGTITAKVSGNTLDLTISDGTIGSIEVISLM